jgi:hypothetical protein
VPVWVVTVANNLTEMPCCTAIPALSLTVIIALQGFGLLHENENKTIIATDVKITKSVILIFFIIYCYDNKLILCALNKSNKIYEHKKDLLFLFNLTFFSISCFGSGQYYLLSF